MRLWKLMVILWLCIGALISTTAMNIPLPVGQAGNQWTMIFSDEFNGNGLDGSKWHTCYYGATDYGKEGCKITDNGELQWYQPDEVLIENGMARLRAQQRQMNGLEYTSGMIASHDKFTFLYGYAEARLRVPAGQGLWPAFWMMAQDRVWPPEIDILEILGDTPQIAHMTLHYGVKNVNHDTSGSYWKGPDFSGDFHTFAVHWQPEGIIWYIDGVERFRVTENLPNKPMYLILNLAVGGRWPGAPDTTTRFPATFDIDYVRVWQPISTPPPTPLPQATGTPLPPPPPTPEPPPTGPTLRVEVSPANANPGQTVNVALRLYNISNLYGLQAECHVDPAILAGASRLMGDVFGNDNNHYELDKGYQASGDWSVAATFLKPAVPFNGSGTAFTLQYRVNAAGSTDIDCRALAVDSSGNSVAMGVVNNQFNANRLSVNNVSVEQPMTQPTAPVQATALPIPQIVAATISGTAAYQKHPDQQGITVRLFSGQNQLAELTTLADGTFAFTDVPNGSYTVVVSAPGHLSLQVSVIVSDDQGASTGLLTLSAGDMDGSGVVDLQDAALLGANYDLPVPPAPQPVDLDSNGTVSLPDLVLLGGNYGQTQP